MGQGLPMRGLAQAIKAASAFYMDRVQEITRMLINDSEHMYREGKGRVISAQIRSMQHFL